MPHVIPEKYLDLFKKPAFASLATLMPNGHPQVTPVWCDFQEGHVLVNSARGRQKDRNMRRDPHVALSIQDPENPYRYLEIRGRVTDISTAWPRNTWGWISIPIARRASSACFTGSSRSTLQAWAKPRGERSIPWTMSCPS
jgi:PPOX class probable F420-dependent enzyme